jgi:hypothetical protein
MKRKNVFFILAFVVALTAAFAANAVAKREPAAYTHYPIFPTSPCTLRTEPLVCTQPGSTICSVSGFTYYSDSECMDVITYN